jgi:hypothetical protein
MLVLRVSREDRPFPVEELMDFLRTLDVEAAAWCTQCTCRSGAGPLRHEHGVQIEFYGCDRRGFSDKVWPALKQRFGLECGHVTEVGSGFAGCTENYLRPTDCPHRATSQPQNALDGGGLIMSGAAPDTSLVAT